MFGETEEEEMECRKAIIRGLATIETEKRLLRLIDSGSLKKYMSMMIKVAWNAFYDQIWKTRCEEVIKWERRNEITSRVKRKPRASEEKKKGKKTRERRNKRSKREGKKRTNEERSIEDNKYACHKRVKTLLVWL